MWRISGLVLLVSVGSVALWEALPTVVGRLVERAVSNPDNLNLRRLAIGHAMAGGERNPDQANVAMADAMKALFTTKLFGVKHTEARGAWRGFVDTLRAAETRYLAPAKGFGLGPPDYAAAEVAEGLRYVAHITRVALELYLEEGPRFSQLISPNLKLIGDNPDSLYYIARVNPEGAYNISGCRAKHEVYFSVAVHEEAIPGEAFQRVAASINDVDLGLDKQHSGCWSVLLAPDAILHAHRERPLPPHTVLQPMPARGATVVTRHYFESNELDQSGDPIAPPAQLNEAARYAVVSTLSITCISAPPAGAPRALPDPTPDRAMANNLAAAAGFVTAHTLDMPQPDPTSAPPFFALSPNAIGPPQLWSGSDQGMGAVDIAYGAGRFLLDAGEVLLIRGRLPRCRFANVVLWNRFLQTFDYGLEKRASISRLQMRLHPKTRQFTVVLSATNPFTSSQVEREAHANWLSSEGRPTGTVFFRFVLPEGAIEQPQTKLLRADEDVGQAIRTWSS